MSKADAVQAVGRLVAAYRQEKVRDETIEVYAEHLQDIRPDVLQLAVRQVINECKFMPTVAEVRAAAKDIQIGLPTPQPYALLGEPFSDDPGPCPTCGNHLAVIVDGRPEPCLWCVVAANEAPPQPAADAPPAPEV